MLLYHSFFFSVTRVSIVSSAALEERAAEDRDTVNLGTIYWVPNDGGGSGMAIGNGMAAVRSLSLGKSDLDQVSMYLQHR